jgi:hypothetical protein
MASLSQPTDSQKDARDLESIDSQLKVIRNDLSTIVGSLKIIQSHITVLGGLELSGALSQNLLIVEQQIAAEPTCGFESIDARLQHVSDNEV